MTDEVRLVDAQETQQIEDGRYGRLPDSHSADLRRLDNRDCAAGAGQRTRQHARGNPAGAATADDGDASNSPIGGGISLHGGPHVTSLNAVRDSVVWRRHAASTAWRLSSSLTA